MVTACVFDAYGTLFDVHAAVRRHAGRLGPQADALSALWRTKQLEYTWVRTLMRQYQDFWSCTEAALDYALAAHGRAGDGETRTLLLEAYRHLEAYPEVRGVLETLRGQGKQLAILSNGTLEMLQEAVSAAGLDDLGLWLLSVDPLDLYKPDPEVYASAVEALGVAPGAISFQSSNAWDVAGARAYGFQTVWINRAGLPEEYGLGGATPVLRSLTDLPALLGGNP